LTAAGRIEAALRFLHRFEDTVLAGLLGVAICLAPLQIALRNFFDTSLAWGEPALRMLVLWIGLFGALVASRDHRQISVDVVSRVLPARARLVTRAVTSAFCAVVAGIIAFYGGRFVASEYEFGTTAFAGLPAWIFQSIIPFAFAAIAIRYALSVARDGVAFAKTPREPA